MNLSIYIQSESFVMDNSRSYTQIFSNNIFTILMEDFDFFFFFFFEKHLYMNSKNE